MDRTCVMIVDIAFMIPGLIVLASIPGIISIIIDILGLTLIIDSIYNIFRFFKVIAERESK